MSVIDQNIDNIKRILKFLSSKPIDKTSLGPNLAILAFYERLANDPIVFNKKIARCIHELLNYSADKPGKIYVWPDNLVNLHRFVTGKTHVFSYTYPDSTHPNELLWRKDVVYDKEYRLIRVTRKQCSSKIVSYYSNSELSKIFEL